MNINNCTLGCEIAISMRLLGAHGLCPHATWHILPCYMHFWSFLVLFSPLSCQLLLLAGLLLKASLLLLFYRIGSQEPELVELYALGEDLWGIP